MDMQANAKLTYDDYVHIPDDGLRHEIIEGEHYVNPAPNIRHQRILRRLLMTLSTFVQERDLGEVFCSPIDVVLSENNVVQPDVLFIRKEQGQADGAFVQMTPDLVVEILSISNRRHDEVRKLKLYDRFNVGEYWIVDPEDEIVSVYRRQNGALTLVAKVAASAVITSPLLPGFKLPAQRVFA
jgi:Uma2 family endonuclease